MERIDVIQDTMLKVKSHSNVIRWGVVDPHRTTEERMSLVHQRSSRSSWHRSAVSEVSQNEFVVAIQKSYSSLSKRTEKILLSLF